MSNFHFSVFASSNSSDRPLEFIPSLRVLHGSPDYPTEEALLDRMQMLINLGQSLATEDYQEVVFTQLLDGSTVASYDVAGLNSSADDMESLIPIDILRQEDLVVQVAYAIQRCTGYQSDASLNQMRRRVYNMFPHTYDSEWPTSSVVPTERRGSRSRGQRRATFFTDEVAAIFFGASNSASMFRFGTDDLNDSQMLGMCTLLHHILLQDELRPVVGPPSTHGLGTFVSRRIASSNDLPQRVPLMVGLLQPSSLSSTQVSNGRGVVFAPYGINSAGRDRRSNCIMEDEFGAAASTVSFGYWNAPDAAMRSSSNVSVIVVYPTTAMRRGTELLASYALVAARRRTPPLPTTPSAASQEVGGRLASPDY